MFKISDYSGNCKTHLCLSLDLANKIVKDLKDRYHAVCKIDEVNDNYYIFDPGGAISATDPKFKFDIKNNFSLYSRSEHWEYLKMNLSNMKEKKEFYKLYGYIYIFCITEEEKNIINKKCKEYGSLYDTISKDMIKRMEG